MKILKELYENSRTSTLAIVIVLMSAIIGGIFKVLDLNLWQSLEVLLFVFLLFVISIFLITYVVSETKNEKLNKFIGLFESDIASLRDWFYSHNRLNEVETTLELNETSEIWVVSKKLEYEKKDGLFRKAIEGNLKKGIKYKYVISDDIELEGTANSLKSGFDIENAHNLIEITKITKENFDYPSDIVVYNPNSMSDTTKPMRMFMELKIDDDPKMRGWIEVSTYEKHEILNHIKRDMGKKSVEQYLCELTTEIKKLNNNG